MAQLGESSQSIALADVRLSGALTISDTANPYSKPCRS